MKTTTAIDSVGSLSDGNSVMYSSPSIDVGGASASFMLGYTPEASDTATGEGAVAGNSGTYGSGAAAGVNVSFAGLSAGAMAEEVENDQGVATEMQNAMSATWYANYSFGPVSVGYQTGGLDMGRTDAAEAATAAKTIAAAGGNFEFEKMSIAFNVNENLSISWGELEETYDAQDNASTAVADVDQDIDAIQIAYSMGGMSVKAYQMEVTNPAFDEDAPDAKVTEIALGLAF